MIFIYLFGNTCFCNYISLLHLGLLASQYIYTLNFAFLYLVPAKQHIPLLHYRNVVESKVQYLSFKCSGVKVVCFPKK